MASHRQFVVAFVTFLLMFGAGWPLTWKTRKSREIKSGRGKVREKGKVRENVFLHVDS